MASPQITLEVQSRGKPIRSLPKEVSVSQDYPASSLYLLLSERSGFPLTRLRVTKGSDGMHIRNAKDVTVASVGLRNRSVIYVKDLGPQAAWRTVYIIEYLGPILIHPLVLYLLRPYIYPSSWGAASSPLSDLQTLTCTLLILHFIKRELETIFVHRFSQATMPAAYIIRNSAHYWILAGANIAYWVFAPTSSTAKPANPLLLYSGLALYVFGQLANFSTHLTLRNLRKPGSTERAIPAGFGFNMVTCPNYFFEVVAWLGIYLVSGLNWSVLLFIAVASATMMKWAAGKEKRYRRDFGDKYKRKRYAMFPGLF